MRGKRSKQYRKLMQQYERCFNFREPYQVLVDAQMLQDVHRCKMDLVKLLARTLHGQIKPMLTQCSRRHLFALSPPSPSDASSSATLTQADKTALLELSYTFELRRCNHHTLPEPLSTLECYKSVIDPKSSGINKHRYILAAQDDTVRQWARSVRGTPLIYLRRSVMIMEPMAEMSIGVREGMEKGKLRGGLTKGDARGKRKRGKEENQDNQDQGEKEAKKRKVYGQKGPNPLSVKKKKAKAETKSEHETVGLDIRETTAIGPAVALNQSPENEVKRKRRRKHKNTGGASTSLADPSSQISIGPNDEL